MGLFDWLFGRRWRYAEPLVDRIWLTEDARRAGIVRETAGASHLAHPPGAVWITSHFSDNLKVLSALVEGAAGEVSAVRLIHVEDLSSELKGGGSRQRPTNLLILVDERHPLRTRDDAILEAVETAEVRARIGFRVSLEDPLLKQFVGSSIQSMLKTLGMKEDEPLESAMVARRIRAAQETLAQQSFGDGPAVSSLEWMRQNYPAMRDA